MAKDSLIKRVLSSIFFRQANSKAVRYARNSTSLLNLIREALQKSGGLTGEKMQVFREHIGLLSRMLKSYASGQYREIPWKTLIRVIAVLIYFVSPIDFIPDLLPVIGITDDIALVVWLISAIRDDIEKFRAWESTQAVNRKEIIPIG
nr:YkvA family protein [uncultured Arsenicibacter sp.]